MPDSEPLDQTAHLEWWANDSFMIGPVEVLVTADARCGRVRDAESEEVEGLEFLCLIWMGSELAVASLCVEGEPEMAQPGEKEWVWV